MKKKRTAKPDEPASTKKWIVEAYDSKEEKWYVSSVHTVFFKARRAKEDLEFAWNEARIREEG